MRHFATAEAKRDFNLVTFFEEAAHRAHLHLVVVDVDARPQLYLLDLDGLLLLARFGGFLLLLVFVFAVVEDLRDGRARIRGNLNKVRGCCPRGRSTELRGCGFHR